MGSGLDGCTVSEACSLVHPMLEVETLVSVLTRGESLRLSEVARCAPCQALQQLLAALHFYSCVNQCGVGLQPASSSITMSRASTGPTSKSPEPVASASQTIGLPGEAAVLLNHPVFQGATRPLPPPCTCDMADHSLTAVAGLSLQHGHNVPCV